MPNNRPLEADRKGRPLPRLAVGRYVVTPGNCHGSCRHTPALGSTVGTPGQSGCQVRAGLRRRGRPGRLCRVKVGTLLREQAHVQSPRHPAGRGRRALRLGRAPQDVGPDLTVRPWTGGPRAGEVPMSLADRLRQLAERLPARSSLTLTRAGLLELASRRRRPADQAAAQADFTVASSPPSPLRDHTSATGVGDRFEGAVRPPAVATGASRKREWMPSLIAAWRGPVAQAWREPCRLSSAWRAVRENQVRVGRR